MSKPSRVQITLRGTSHSFDVPEDALSILDAGLDAGYRLPYSCCAGICTSCVARCLSGRVRPRAGASDSSAAATDPSDDEYGVLTRAEQQAGYFLCCQSLPDSATLEISFDEPLALSHYSQ